MTSELTTHAFVCSKPYQLVSILNLPYDFEDKSVRKILFILNHFPNADDVAARVQQAFPYWYKVEIIQEREELADLLKQYKVSLLYTDIDTGKTAYRWSLLVNEMNVYEEGTQNYRSIRNDYVKYPITLPFRGIVTKVLGWGAYLGSNRKTKHVYVYNPNFFKIYIPSIYPKVELLKKELYTFLNDNLSALNHLFPVPERLQHIKNEKVAIYLTAHWLNTAIFQKLQNNAHLYDKVLIKVHPQIFYKSPELEGELAKLPFDVIKENFIAEIMFMLLLNNGNDITIFHESSTACIYLRESDKVKLHDYREGYHREVFDKLRDTYFSASYTFT